MSKPHKSVPPAFDSLISYMLPFDKKGKGQVNFDISEQEFGVIGYVVVQWSFLEAILYAVIREMYEAAGKPIPVDAKANAFKTRLRVFYDAIQNFVTDATLKEKQVALYNRIGQAADDRHTIAHGIWTYDPKSPDELWALNRREDLAIALDSMKLWELGNKIGELSFELLHPQGYTFADSLQEMVEENTDENGFTSYIGGRFARMMLSGKKRVKRLMEITNE